LAAYPHDVCIALCPNLLQQINEENLAEYAGGLEFLTDELPGYWIFLYFTISMTSQTSDVSIISRQICRIVLEQELVSFFFYDKYEINMNKI